MNDNSIKEFLKGILIIAFSVFVIFYFREDFKNSFMEPPYLFDLKFEELTDGVYVQEDINTALDSFMCEEVKIIKYGIERSSFNTSYYYIIPIISENHQQFFMAVEVGLTAEYIMDSICEDTLTGKNRNSSNAKSYHVKGSLQKMTEEELQYMVEWFQTTEYFGTTNAAEIKSHILPIVLKKDTGTISRIVIIAAFIFILVGLNNIFNGLSARGTERNYNSSHRYSTPSYSSTPAPYTPYQTGYNSQNQLGNEYSIQQNNGYLNQQNNGYLNQQNNRYLNQQNNGYLNQQNNGYLSQQNNGYLNQQNNGYLNQQNNGYLNQQNNGHLNQHKSYLNWQNTPKQNEVLNQKNTSQQDKNLHQDTNSQKTSSSGLSDAFFKIDDM